MIRALKGRAGLKALLAFLLLAATLSAFLPGCAATRRALVDTEAQAVLADIDAGNGPSDLKSSVPLPQASGWQRRVGRQTVIGDLYQPADGDPRGGILLVPGMTRLGKDDPRTVSLAYTLARARFQVVVPELTANRDLRISAQDADVIGAAARAMSADLGRPVVIAAVSYAVAPALIAAIRPDVNPAVQAIFGLGGFYSTDAVAAFALTGRYRLKGETGWRERGVWPQARWIFIASHAALLPESPDRTLLLEIARRRLLPTPEPVEDLVARLGPAGRSVMTLVTTTEPATVAGKLAALPAPLPAMMAALDPARQDLRPLQGKLILVHGREDEVIPWTESQALADAVPGSRLFLIDDFGHVERRGIAFTAQLQLVTAVRTLLDLRAP